MGNHRQLGPSFQSTVAVAADYDNLAAAAVVVDAFAVVMQWMVMTGVDLWFVADRIEGRCLS